MRHIIDTFTMCNYSAPIDRQVPEVEDVKRVFKPRTANLAIQIFACDEEYVRYHLRIGSTPITKLDIGRPKWRQQIIHKALWKFFHESFICL